MKDNDILDDIIGDTNHNENQPLTGVKSSRHDSRARLIVVFYSAINFLYLLFGTSYKNQEILSLTGIGVELFGYAFIVYYNYKLLLIEKIDKVIINPFPLGVIVCFLLMLGLLLVDYINRFLTLIQNGIFNFQSLVVIAIVISIVIIALKEFKYLRSRA